MDTRQQLEQAIAALEAQRAILGDAVVDTMIATARKELAALDDTPAAEQRKLVTVLFADTSGFTAMSEKMDAEDVQEVMNALIRDLFSFRFQIQENDPARIVRQKMERGVGEMPGTDEKGRIRTHVIGQLIGFDFSDSPFLKQLLHDAQQLRDRALSYLSEFFSTTTAQYPTVIFLREPQEPRV
jgi:hypothetical protein